MKILIFGGNGMIGHKIFQELSKDFENTWVVIRKSKSELAFLDFFSNDNATKE